jgi:hypothetical protein
VLAESLMALGDQATARDAAAVARIDELAGQIDDPVLRASFLAVEDNARVLELAGELASA